VAKIDASRVETLRRARGFSQRVLSEAAGVTRQAVGAIESGRMQPSVGIALGLARALGTTVEELFATGEQRAPRASRIAAGTIGGRPVSHALSGDQLAIEPSESLVPSVFVAGCDLAVGLLARHASARSRDSRVIWLTMTNRAALAALARSEVHAAILHDVTTLSGARQLRDFVRFELATTRAGWLVRDGNPLGLRGAADLSRTKARLANRPTGAGARRLLDEQLRHAKVDPRKIAGYDRELAGQLDAGRAIAQGFADAAIGLASVARVFGLQFLSLREERCTLLVPRAATRTHEVAVLLDALRSISYRRDLEAFESYDVSRTGEQSA
jgi:molybdate-binding protein/DNA-binding XRE family transcriptional regulator